MNTALFYDTETSGLPLFKEPSEDPRQPHIVQLGALLVDLDTDKTLASMDVIVRPNGWTIPTDVAAIHGITTEMAMDLGIPEGTAVEMLLEMWRPSAPRLRIGHNESFDARIMRIALMRHCDADMADQWKAGQADCTAVLTTKLCALPPTEAMRRTGRTHFKTPKLTEAYRHLFGRELQNAHSAMADAQACREVYQHVKRPVPVARAA